MRSVLQISGFIATILAVNFSLSAFAVSAVEDIQSGNLFSKSAQPIVGPSNSIPVDHWSYKLVQKMAEQTGTISFVNIDGSHPLTRTEMAVALADISENTTAEALQENLSEREKAQYDILREEFQAEMKVLEARIEKVENSVDRLSSIVHQKITQDRTDITYPNIKLIGLLQAWETAGAYKALPNKGFNIYRAELGATGEVAPDWKYRLTFDLARSINLLKDAYMDYTGFKNYVIRVGQMRPGVTYNASVRGAGKSYFYDYSQIGLMGDERERGAAVYGSFKKLVDYQLGIYNGNDENHPDQNNNPAFGGRATLRPLAYLLDEKKWGKLEIGGSFLKGHTGVDRNEIRRDRFGAEARYIHPKFELGWEYLKFDTPVRQNGYGWYLEGIYKITPKWQLVARYDFLEPNKTLHVDNDRVQYVAGVNYLVAQYNMKLGLEYILYTDQAKISRGNAIRLLAQYMF